MFIKLGVQTLPPLTLACGRMALAALLLLAFAAARGHGWPRAAGVWRGFLVVGLLGNALPFYLIHWGELSIDSGLAAILMGVMPLATAGLAHFLTAEPLRGGRLAGVLLGFTGLLVLVGGDALAGLGTQVLAQGAVLVGALCYALTTVFVRRSVRAPGAVMAAGALSVGTLLLAPLAAVLEQPWHLAPSAVSLAAMGVLGVFSTGFAALLYFHLLRHLGATYFAQVNYWIPLLGVGWGWALLGEQPPLRALAALALILAGVVLVHRAHGKAPATPAQTPGSRLE